MVGVSAARPPPASVRRGVAQPLGASRRRRRRHGDLRPLPPHPPGRVAADGEDTPPGVQQGELHGAGRHHDGRRKRGEGSGAENTLGTRPHQVW